jgi:AcrR family transcriptional regulator
MPTAAHRLAANRRTERGEATRTAILEATNELLKTTRWHDVTVMGVMRQIYISPSKFWSYFENIHDVVRALSAGPHAGEPQVLRVAALIAAEDRAFDHGARVVR